MLDQNTDRMWFVIGAVIVGAAIIFIANGTLPDVFASVTNSFKGSSDEALQVVETIDVSDAIYDVEDLNLTNLSGSELDSYMTYGTGTHNMKYFRIPLSGKVTHGSRVKITGKISNIGEDLEFITIFVHPSHGHGTDYVTKLATVHRSQLDEKGEFSFYTTWKNKDDLPIQRVRLDNGPSRITRDADFRLDSLSIQRVIEE